MRYITDLDKLTRIPPLERERLKQVAARYAFRVNDYYLGLIDWQDPADPIRRLVIPDQEELEDWGALDASNESANSPVRGVQHKYPHTVLLLCNEVCGAYCRYCFRKRLFMNDNDEVSTDVSAGLEYIAQRPQVTNVLLTGGDPLLMSTRRLGRIIEGLRAIPHVQIIRIGSKMPAFDPWRISGDPALLDLFRRMSTPQQRIYLMAHFDHPRELTEPALEGLAAGLDAGLAIVNQNPIIAGINDHPEVLAELFRRLSFAGVAQYYLFQGRPTAGNKPFETTIVHSYRVVEEAKTRVSGLAKRARLVMSHESGKIEIVGVDRRHIYLRYHRARDPRNEGRMLVCRRDDDACWLDDLVVIEGLGGGRPPWRDDDHSASRAPAAQALSCAG
ncbi:KamA family radical SAM protein [Myxococcota bacterium]|nr:KamA family radical SAM protein [Myxococcota bacterium]